MASRKLWREEIELNLIDLICHVLFRIITRSIHFLLGQNVIWGPNGATGWVVLSSCSARPPDHSYIVRLSWMSLLQILSLATRGNLLLNLNSPSENTSHIPCTESNWLLLLAKSCFAMVVIYDVYCFLYVSVCCLPRLMPALGFMIVCCPPRPTLVFGLPVVWTVILCLLMFDPACTTLSLIKLQMDPHSTSASLQKTLPTHVPAAMAQLSSEVSAQANQLATNQH